MTRGWQSGMKFMLEILKCHLLLHILQERRRIRIEMSINRIEGPKERNHEENPFHIMNGRIMDLEIEVRAPLDQNSDGPDEGEGRGSMSPGYHEMGGRLRTADNGPDEKPRMPENEQVKADMKEVEKIPELTVSMIIFPQEGDIKDHRFEFIAEREIGPVPPVRKFVNRTPPIEFPPQVKRSRDVKHDFPDGSNYTKEYTPVKDE